MASASTTPATTGRGAASPAVAGRQNQPELQNRRSAQSNAAKGGSGGGGGGSGGGAVHNTADTISLVEEVSTVFQSGDDAKNVAQLGAKADDIRKASAQREAGLAALCEKLHGKVRNMEGELERAEPEEDHRRAMAALESRKKAIIGEIMELEEQCGAHDVELRALQAEACRASERYAALLDELRDVVPRRRNVRSLYAEITNIRLSYHRPESCTAGYVAFTEPPELRPFEFDADSKLSDLERVNAVWRLMEP